MALIQWQDWYSVGVPVIDADHQLLISLLNQLHDAREEGQARSVISSVLTVLVEYTLGHFRREEALMARSGYDDLEAHRLEHQALARRVEELRADYLGGRHGAVDELAAFLKSWLTGHILAVDKRYKPYVSKIEWTADDLLSPIDAAEEPSGGPAEGEASAKGAGATA